MLYRLSYVRAPERISRLAVLTQSRALAIGLAAALDAAAHLVEEARAVRAVLVRDEMARHRILSTGCGGVRAPVWSIHGLPHPACGFCGRIACRPPPARSAIDGGSGAILARGRPCASLERGIRRDGFRYEHKFSVRPASRRT